MNVDLSLPTIGLVLFLMTLIARLRAHTTNTALGLVSGLFAFIACLIWPVSNSILFDHVVGGVGLGRIVSELAMATGTLFHMIIVGSLSQRWAPWRKKLAAGYAVFLTPYVLGWLATQRLTGYDLSHLYYHRYLGWPLPVLVLNLASGAFVIYAYLINAALYISQLRRAQNTRERVSAWCGTIAYSAAVVFGVLVIAQALADLMGRDASTLHTLMVLVIGLTCLIMSAAPVGFTVIRPAWHYLRELLSVQRKLAKVTFGQAAMIKLSVFVSELLVCANIDPALLERIDASSKKHKLPPYQHAVTLQAGRLCLLACAGVMQLPWFDTTPPADTAFGQASVLDLLNDVEQQALLCDDGLRVTALVLGPDRVPGSEPEHEPDGWRHTSAAIIAEVLQEQGYTVYYGVGRNAGQTRHVAR